MTGSEHMLHAGGKVSAFSSFSLEEQNEIEQSPQRWCGWSEAQRTPLWSWESESEQAQHSIDGMCPALPGLRGSAASRVHAKLRGGESLILYGIIILTVSPPRARKGSRRAL